MGCVVLAAVVAAAGPGRDGPGDRVRVLQMNLCNSGLAGCYTGRAVATAVEVIRAQTTDVVTLNEVCRADVAVLTRRPAKLTTGGIYPTQDPTGPEQRAWLCLDTVSYTHLRAHET